MLKTEEKTPRRKAVQHRETLSANNDDVLPQKEQTGDLHLVHQAYSGPLPPPETLHGYDQIVPGAAERILTMAEKNAAHRHEIEFAALDAHRAEIRRGQTFGFGIGIAALLTAAFALYLDHPATAGIIGGTTVVGLVTVFVVGKSSNENEPDERNDTEHTE